MTSGAAKVLIVEDEAIIAEDLDQMVQELGYQPIGRAATFDQGLDLARLHSPQIALLDVEIRSARDGISLAEFLRGEGVEILIFITSHVDGRTLTRAQRVNPDGYITKPFSRDQLHAAIELAWADRFGVNDDVEGTGARLSPQQTDDLTSFIDRNFNRALTTSELAARLDMSPGHLTRLFRATFDATPVKYITRLRIEEAKRLLLATNMPLVEIALSVGFDSQAYFTSVFRKQTGTTPGAFRRGQ